MDSSRLYYLYYVGSSEMRCRSGQAGERVYCAPKCRLFKLMLLNLFLSYGFMCMLGVKVLQSMVTSALL